MTTITLRSIEEFAALSKSSSDLDFLFDVGHRETCVRLDRLIKAFDTLSVYYGNFETYGGIGWLEFAFGELQQIDILSGGSVQKTEPVAATWELLPWSWQ